jgi:hypothetical protein
VPRRLGVQVLSLENNKAPIGVSLHADDLKTRTQIHDQHGAVVGSRAGLDCVNTQLKAPSVLKGGQSGREPTTAKVFIHAAEPAEKGRSSVLVADFEGNEAPICFCDKEFWLGDEVDPVPNVAFTEQGKQPTEEVFDDPRDLTWGTIELEAAD